MPWSILLFFIGSSQLFAQTTIPRSAPDSIDTETSLRLLINRARFGALLEAQYLNQEGGRNMTSLTFGPRWRAWRFLKFGLFYRRVYGLLYDEDWVKVNTIWQWEKVNGRGENQLILEIKPRFLLSEQLLGEFRVRALSSSFRHKKLLKLRPGLSYLYFSQGRPRWTFFSQIEAYIPLNYGQSFLYEYWIYMGALKHLNHVLKIGAHIAYKVQKWNSTDDFTADTGARWGIKQKALLVGFMINFVNPFLED